MTHNDTFDRVRATLKLTDADVLTCFSLAGRTLTTEAQAGLGAQVQGEARTLLTDALLADFLDGLIINRRGPSPSGSGGRVAVTELTNNMILKKLRIALNLQGEDMRTLFESGGKTLSDREVTVLFRKPTHTHYKTCEDDLLNAFLDGVKKR